MISKPIKDITSVRLRRRVLGYKLYIASRRRDMATRRNEAQIEELLTNIKKE
jgi:hypothetical protein